MDSHINLEIKKVITRLNDIKHVTSKGGEYWTGRELMRVLEYARWENFSEAIERAKRACININEDILDHFRETTNMIEAGKGAKVKEQDYFLDRYACYLIAQNGDPSKVAVAAAQTYFAI